MFSSHIISCITGTYWNHVSSIRWCILNPIIPNYFHVCTISGGKSSRHTGWTLFVSHCFDQDRPTDRRNESWKERRSRVAKEASRKWNEKTYEMRKVREQFSEKAKQCNNAVNRKRKLAEFALEDQRQIELDEQMQLQEQQKNITNILLDNNMVFGEGQQPNPPSILRPIALVDYANQQDIDSSDQVVPLDQETAMVEFRNESAQDLANLSSSISKNKHSLYGVGDNEFGVSETILDECLRIPKFIQQSDQQFVRQHSSVCNDAACFELEPTDELENFKSCQQLCGRYCRKDITNMGLFQRFVGLVKTIARIMGSRRTVKNGDLLFMSPACQLPVLLIETETALFARLACRVSLNPLEVDFICCDVQRIGNLPDQQCEDNPIEYKVTLRFEHIDGSTRLSPGTDTMCELSVWLSNMFVDGAGHKFTLFIEYELHEHQDHVLLLRRAHKSSTTDSPDESSFSELLVEKTKKKCDMNEDDALSSISNILSVLDKKDKKKKRSQPNALALKSLTSKPKGT